MSFASSGQLDGVGAAATETDHVNGLPGGNNAEHPGALGRLGPHRAAGPGSCRCPLSRLDHGVALAPVWLDQGILAAVGDVIRRGGMPYHDGWDMKGPVAFYRFALAQWVFGRHLWSARVLDALLLLGGSAVVARIVARFGASVWGALPERSSSSGTHR